MKVVTMKNRITLRKRVYLIKRVSVKRRKNSVSKRKVFTPKRNVAHLKRAMEVSPTVIEKIFYSWHWKQRIMPYNVKTEKKRS